MADLEKLVAEAKARGILVDKTDSAKLVAEARSRGLIQEKRDGGFGLLPLARKTLELGGTVFGGLEGAAAGTILAGPGIGTLAGGLVGAGVGKATGSQAATVIESMAGKPPQTLGSQFKTLATKAVEGAEEQAVGGTLGPVVGKSVALTGAGLKKMAPWILKATANVATKVTDLLVRHNFKVAKPMPGEIETGVKNIQDALIGARKKLGQELGELRGTNTEAMEVLNEIAEKGPVKTTPQEVATKFFSYFNKPVAESQKPTLEAMELRKMWAELTKEQAGSSISYDQMRVISGYLNPHAVAGPGKEKALIKELLALRNSMREQISKTTLDQSGKVVKAISSTEERAFNAGIDHINKEIEKLPNGKAIRATEKKFSEMADIYDDLQKKISEEGKGEDFLRKVFESDAAVYKDWRGKLAHLEQVTGKPLLTDLFKKFAGEEAGKLVGRPYVAGLAIGGMFVNPLFASLTLTAQSPKAMTSLARGIIKTGSGLSKAASLSKIPYIAAKQSSRQRELNSLEDNEELRSLRDKLGRQ